MRTAIGRGGGGLVRGSGRTRVGDGGGHSCVGSADRRLCAHEGLARVRNAGGLQSARNLGSNASAGGEAVLPKILGSKGAQKLPIRVERCYKANSKCIHTYN